MTSREPIARALLVTHYETLGQIAICNDYKFVEFTVYKVMVIILCEAPSRNCEEVAHLAWRVLRKIDFTINELDAPRKLGFNLVSHIKD